MAAIIEQALELISSRAPSKQADLLQQFTKRYYANINPEELSNRSAEELYQIVTNHWAIINSREPKSIHIGLCKLDERMQSEYHQRSIIQISADNMPFLVDSIHMALNRMGYPVDLMIHFGGIAVARDKSGHITKIFSHKDKQTVDLSTEAPVCVEISRLISIVEFKAIAKQLKTVIRDVQLAVDDWSQMRECMQDSIDKLEIQKQTLNANDVDESIEFMRWLLDNHFTFLGCRDYKIIAGDKTPIDKCRQELIPGTGLGVLRLEDKSKKVRPYSELPAAARKIALSKNQVLIISKTNTRSTVHRDAYSDYIGVKQFDENGDLVFERRFIGLFTSSAYSSNPKVIPLLRQKIKAVMNKSGLPDNSHSGKDLGHILATLPRDDLFHSSAQELFRLSMGILQLQDRRQIRLFIHNDAYGRYISCLVYMPKENFNTDVLLRVRDILMSALHGKEVSFDTSFGDAVLCRVHYIIRIDSSMIAPYNTKALEQKIIEASQSWRDSLTKCIIDYFGEESGAYLVQKYKFAFHAGYREAFPPRHAIFDIEMVEKLADDDGLQMTFYRPVGGQANQLCLKLFHLNSTIPLSDALPMLENLGLRIIGEQPYLITLPNNQQAWINDFSMCPKTEVQMVLDDIKDIFQQAFKQVWLGNAENDRLNCLILASALTWQEVNLLRAYSAYLRQIGASFSQRYIEDTLVKNSSISGKLIKLFHHRFNPELAQPNIPGAGYDIEAEIVAALDNVSSRDEDRIIRLFIEIIKSTVRTNFYQTDNANIVDYLAFKLDPKDITIMPKPKPKHELFIYSAQFEGIHLRAGDIARGGLRWSDRKDDFRTEVLGLMKAQVVKNSVIVPSGAKGGFVVKSALEGLSREDYMQSGISCYKNFIRGLLSLTDNYVDSEIVQPNSTICYDQPDPYFVVAADKGTATFSDIANEIAVKEKNFWLGDAFASGGQSGYDHKKMGITARGAWVSALHHFNSLGINPEIDTFTVIGIGDMSGDVFGNGLLMSENTKLVAAFNHMHIFIDPDPDPMVSYQERMRLFNTPRSTWADYDPKLISNGGAVFARAAKLINISEPIRALLNIDYETLEPNGLIRCILKAKTDLLWNGGVGTFIKSESETDFDVGDRNNDAIRINGGELGAKIFCEGGNLGATQRGRIEYALAGGLLNTDFIDNSAGVDCSDHEVNIKILLADVMQADEMTLKQRNQLLSSMSEQVAEHVLRHNQRQNEQLTVATVTAPRYLNLYERYIDELDKDGILDRQIECLPDLRTFARRAGDKLGLTRPELAVLMSYTKINLKQRILKSDLFDDPYMLSYLFENFPMILKRRYATLLFKHRLKNEIIATEFSHRLVSDMGITFLYQLQDETGASLTKIAAAYEAARHIFHMEHILSEIRQLHGTVNQEMQIKMSIKIASLVRRASRWLVREHSLPSIKEIIDQYSKSTTRLYTRLPKLLLGDAKQEMETLRDDMLAADVPEAIATKVACCISIYHSLNITEAAESQDIELFRVAKIYFMLVDRMELQLFREQIDTATSDTRWAVLAKAAFKADLDYLQRQLTISVLNFATSAKSIPGRIKAWNSEFDSQLKRWQDVMAGLRAHESNNKFAIISVALKELADIVMLGASAKGENNEQNGQQN